MSEKEPKIQRHSGMTLLEVMVSCVLGFSVLLGASLIFQKSSGLSKGAIRQQSQERASSQVLNVIERDCSKLFLRLPISYGCGELNKGWDFLHGVAKEWDAPLGYGSEHISLEASEANLYPCDRLGFFMDEGTTGISHVLYFTAHTVGEDPLNLSNQEVRLKAPRRLFRHYTSPKRLRERLKMVNPNTSGGGKEMLGIPRYLTNENKCCAEPFLPSDTRSSRVLSLVASNVISFEAELVGSLFRKEKPSDRSLNFSSQLFSLPDLKECLIHYSADEVADFHGFLKGDFIKLNSRQDPRFHPERLKLTLSLHPKEGVSHLTKKSWAEKSEAALNTFPESCFSVTTYCLSLEIQ